MPRTIRNPNYQGPFGNTLLHSAAVSGDLQELERLLAAGADPVDREPRRPHGAARRGDPRALGASRAAGTRCRHEL